MLRRKALRQKYAHRGGARGIDSLSYALLDPRPRTARAKKGSAAYEAPRRIAPGDPLRVTQSQIIR
jgi:hypothetical protein